MIDTHAHVHSRAFDRDRAAVLERASAAGVHTLIEVNIDVAGWPASRALIEAHPQVFGTVGIHPHDVARASREEFEQLAAAVTHPKVRAVGETGIDYYRDYAPYELQRDFFRLHVRLARESERPIVVHARQKSDGPSAHEDVLSILEEEGRGEVRGVLHCFSGDLEVARRAHALGFKRSASAAR
ncbi:MAG: TatD family hydrolase [Candidatus Eisenbacteria bacterium]